MSVLLLLLCLVLLLLLLRFIYFIAIRGNWVQLLVVDGGGWEANLFK